ncbi:MAG: carboxypeptidase regulatory-like domain-containing protein [Acidobacteria bacterium]|nr:carboxypeptidase regulatory-like domain-containing protein [Acidobacteriota bacterium]
MRLRFAALLSLAILAAAPSRASCIHGYVKGVADRAIPGATITIFERESDAARSERREQVHPRAVFRRGVSNAKGWFRVDPRRRGNYDVLVTAPGYAPRLLRAAAGVNLGNVQLTPARETRVAFTCGQAPIVGAPVVVVARDGAELFLNTDPAGALRIPEPALWVDEVVVATSTGPLRLHQPRLTGAVELASCRQ